MSGSSFVRGISLSGAALLALACLAAPGWAGSNGTGATGYGEDYSAPAIIRRIPGLRILFGMDTPPQDANSQPGDKKKKKIDESYYEPQPAPAKPKVVKPAAPKTAVAPANPALPQKTASAAPAKPPGDGPLTCEKATELVSGYGFSSVEASSCTGTVYAFNAKRGGKSFAIKLNPASGQLTEVKKLP
ncbi:MAG: hypothetical protein NTZ54_01060 [Alphaproteobacteria bacterium]|nr:hypothetical protein [Alphaproteobacteria bacterium]